MNWEQRQVVLGTLLGNAFLCKGDYLCIQHSKKNEDYLRLKAEVVSEYARPTPFYEKSGTVGWRSSRNPIWQEFRTLCYTNDQKMVSMRWLDEMHAIAMTIWYCDSGSLIGYRRRNACLRTQSFGQGNEIIKQYFSEIGIPCSMNKSKKSWIIVFGVEETEAFLKIVAPYVPTFLHDKLLRRD